MKKLLALLLVAVLMVGLFAGCASTDTTDTTDTNNTNTTDTTNTDSKEEESTESDSSEDNKRDHINVSLSSSITTLDSMESTLAINHIVAKALFDSLTDFDENWDVVPALAESYEISDDGMTYIYTLREGVTFHSGDPLTPDDVVYSVERGKAAAPLAATFGKYCAGAEALDDRRVALHLTQPYTPFATIVSKELVIHNRSYHDEYIAEGHTEAEYLMHVDGTGPYKFVSYEDGIALELEANENYWAGAPAIKYWHGKIVTDNNARALAMEAGDIDFVSTQVTIPQSSIATLEANDNVNVIYTDFMQCGSVMLNCRLPEFQDVRVRKALNYAVDYDWLIETQTEGKGVPISCAYITEKTTGFSTADSIVNYTYDLEKAKELLAEAGYPNGEGFPVINAVITEQRKGCMEVLQQCWAELGLTVEINVVESSSVWDTIDSGNYSVGIVFNNVMVDTTMYDWYFGDPDTGALNRTGYENPELWELQEQAAVEMDPDKRQELFDQIWTIITDECPVVWMYQQPQMMYAAEGLHVSGTYPTNSVVHWNEFYWE